MTQYEALVWECNHLVCVIRQRKEKLNRIKTQFEATTDNNQRKYLKHEYEQEVKLLQSNVECYHELDDYIKSINTNSNQSNNSEEHITADDLNPNRFLCDKIWSDKHSR